MASICIFEEEGYKTLLPLAWMRPVFDLRCGINTLYEKVKREYPRVSTYLFCREYLVDTLKGRYPGTILNKFGKENSILFVNAQVIFDSALAKVIPINGVDEIFEHEGRVVAARFGRDNLEAVKSKMNGVVAKDMFKSFQDGVRLTKVDARFIDHFSDLIRENGPEIENDFKGRTRGGLIKGRVHQSAVLTPKDRIFVDDGANIEAYAIIDAKEGTVYIGKGVTIASHVTIEGPAFIGDRSVVMEGRIRGNTSIGPYSKVCGEISGTIIQGYSNKQHYGFIGSSYIGEWVNLGAGTTNSNLKNNYGSIKVKYMDNEIDSGQTFLGACICDHVKLGIGTLINSGSVIGIGSNVFGGGMIPKYIPSFAWTSAKNFDVYNIEKAIKTAGAVMKRRGVEISDDHVTLLRKIFELTEGERKALNK